MTTAELYYASSEIQEGRENDKWYFRHDMLKITKINEQHTSTTNPTVLMYVPYYLPNRIVSVQ